MLLKTSLALAAFATGLASAQMNSTNTTMMSMPTSAAPAPTSYMPTASNTTCGPGLSVCYVSDPTRKEAPWAGSSGRYPQCYDPSAYSCTFNFLCPVGTVKLAGLYACSEFGQTSNGTSFANVTTNNTMLGSPSNQMLQAVVNAPSVGDIDGINAADFIVDISFNALSESANSAIPEMPLYQDSNSSTFGPGPNAAFPGLVVLQNTTSQMLGGPNANLAGVFQLNGVSQRLGRNQWNAVWQAAGPLFGVGPSELVVYYVEGTAGRNATYRPTSGLLSNVVRVPFTISNRTENEVVGESPMCMNGDVYQTPSSDPNLNSLDVLTSVQVAVPYPAAGDMVGVDGSGWLMSVAGTTFNDADNMVLSNASGYTAGYISPSSDMFAPGANPYVPGLVVTLNTTQDSAPFSGPMTNLAGLFQANAARVVNCNTMIQTWSSWYVGMPIAGTGPVQATVYFVSGDAPDMVDENTPSNAISAPAMIDFIIA